MHANQKRSSHFTQRVFFSLIATAATLLLVHVVLKFVSIVIFDEKHGFFFELSNRFDVNDENSVPQWFSQMQFLLIAFTAAIAGYLQTNPVKRRLWYVMAGVGLLLSIDDVATLHEFALQSIHNTMFLDQAPSFLKNAWWILLAFISIPALILAWQGWKNFPKRTILLIILGGATYVIGKILMDSLANNVSDLFIDRGLVQGAEKLFQYLGSSIVIYANIDYLEKHHQKKIHSALQQLKTQVKS